MGLECVIIYKKIHNKSERLRMLKILIASNNEGKIKEIREIFKEIAQIQSQKEAGIDIEPKETGKSFQENALIKAYAVFEKLQDKALKNEWLKDCDEILVLADDSGICVDILHGEPGIKSARYANTSDNDTNSSDEQNRLKLISELQKHKVRESSARFVACVAIIGKIIGKVKVGAKSHVKSNAKSHDKDKSSESKMIEFCGFGECEGKVITQQRGDNGFGYDCMFVPDGFDKTLAELEPQVKNTISHRKKALEQVREYISEHKKS